MARISLPPINAHVKVTIIRAEDGIGNAVAFMSAILSR